VHPIESLPLQGLDRLPGPLLANDFGLVEAIDGLCKRIVVAVSGAAHRRLDVCLSEPLAVADGDVLGAPVAVVDQSAGGVWLSGVEACSRAPSTKSVFMLRLTLQPTMNREDTSTIKATYANPCQVETKVPRLAWFTALPVPPLMFMTSHRPSLFCTVRKRMSLQLLATGALKR